MTSELDLARAFIDAHPDDAARALERQLAADAGALIDALPPATAARVLASMTATSAADCLAGLAPRTAAAVVEALPTDRAAALLRLADDDLRRTLLEHLPASDARALQAMLRYPEGSAGSLMDRRVVAVAEDLSVGEALEALRRSPRQGQDYLYVVERPHRLVGFVPLRELIAARPEDPLSSVLNRAVSRLPAMAGRGAVLAHPAWRRYHAIPVVDEDSVLVGAISHETLRALEAEDALSRRGRPDAGTTVFALGELYWLGLSGVIDGLAAAAGRNLPAGDISRGGVHGGR